MAELTLARLREVLHYDPKTGDFTRPNRIQGQKAKVGYINTGSTPKYKRLVIQIDGKSYKAHRLAWFYMTGKWPDNEIDHDNDDPLDNKWLNLKDVTHQMNTSKRSRLRAGGMTDVGDL